MIQYYGGTDIVDKPEIRIRSGGRDFGMGFYCTDIRSQAGKWARRQGKIRKQTPVLNIVEYFNCGENEALKMFYESHIGECYGDDSTGLYGQSAAYVFSLFCEEKEDRRN